MKNFKNKAFTLVELIVVITILAVLATVAFISFQGYSTESRDTKRMTDIATLSKGLQVYLAANSQVPEPSETKTTVSFSGSELLTQGYAGKSVLDTLRVKEAKDPVDETFYTYSINANNTKFQVLSLLEKNQTAKNFMNNNLFADYSDRNIYSAGQSVGILLDETNTPIQELGSTSVDLQTSTDSFQTILSQNKVISQTGSNLKTQILGAQENLFGWRAFDPNCPIDDIHIGNQVWAGCNSTLGDGIEWGKLDSGENGVINDCYNYDGASNNLDPLCSPDSSIMGSTQNPYEFFQAKQPDGLNNNSDSEKNTIWGKLYTWENSPSACPVGWHIPNNDQWAELENTLYGGECRINNNWECDELGWRNHNTKNKQNNIVQALQIPLAGFRGWEGDKFHARGNRTHIWSSSENSEQTTGYTTRIGWEYIGVNRATHDKTYAFSVRCIKD